MVRFTSDPAIFEAELQKIWYRTWVYVGHESEVPNADDYVANRSVCNPIIMTRGRAGQDQSPAQSLFPSRQSGLLLRQGQCAILTCPFHPGLSPATDGLSAMPFPTAMKARDKAGHGLGRVTRVHPTAVSCLARSPPKARRSTSISAAPPRRSTVWFAARRKVKSRSRRASSSIASRPTGNSSWRTNATAIIRPLCIPRSLASPTARIGTLYGGKSTAMTRDYGNGHTEIDLRPEFRKRDQP